MPKENSGDILIVQKLRYIINKQSETGDLPRSTGKTGTDEDFKKIKEKL